MLFFLLLPLHVSDTFIILYPLSPTYLVPFLFGCFIGSAVAQDYHKVLRMAQRIEMLPRFGRSLVGAITFWHLFSLVSFLTGSLEVDALVLVRVLSP